MNNGASRIRPNTAHRRSSIRFNTFLEPRKLQLCRSVITSGFSHCWLFIRFSTDRQVDDSWFRLPRTNIGYLVDKRPIWFVRRNNFLKFGDDAFGIQTICQFFECINLRKQFRFFNGLQLSNEDSLVLRCSNSFFGS